MLRLFKPDLVKTRRRPPRVTVRSDGRLTFNAEASRALEAADLRRVRLFGDPATGRVVIRGAMEDGPETHLISYLKPRPTQIRATLEARPFLVWLGYLKPIESDEPAPTSKATSAIQRFELHPIRPYRGLNAFEFYCVIQDDSSVPRKPHV